MIIISSNDKYNNSIIIIIIMNTMITCWEVAGPGVSSGPEMGKLKRIYIDLFIYVSILYIYI